FRVGVVLAALTLTASAQTPPKTQAKAPERTSGALCERIAQAAFEANRAISISDTAEPQSEPFVRAWLVRSGLVVDAARRIVREGEDRTCEGGIFDRCNYVGESLEKRIERERDSGPGLGEEYVWRADQVGFLPYKGDLLEVRAAPDFS